MKSKCTPAKHVHSTQIVRQVHSVCHFLYAFETLSNSSSSNVFPRWNSSSRSTINYYYQMYDRILEYLMPTNRCQRVCNCESSTYMRSLFRSTDLSTNCGDCVCVCAVCGVQLIAVYYTCIHFIPKVENVKNVCETCMLEHQINVVHSVAARVLGVNALTRYFAS